MAIRKIEYPRRILAPPALSRLPWPRKKPHIYPVGGGLYVCEMLDPEYNVGAGLGGTPAEAYRQCMETSYNVPSGRYNSKTMGEW
jgi:hypothetical protein